jgi:hypothetical protein
MEINFNKVIKAKQRDINDEFRERLASCVPVANKIFEMMVEEKLPIGEINDKHGKMKSDIIDSYDNFAAKVLTFMLSSGVKYSDRKFIFQLMKQPFELAEERILRAIGISKDKADEKKWGKDELDITMGDIHSVLLE